MVEHILGVLPSKVFYVALSIIVGVFLGVGSSLIALADRKLDKEIYYKYEERAEARHVLVISKLEELKVTLAGHKRYD